MLHLDRLVSSTFECSIVMLNLWVENKSAVVAA